MHWGGKDQPKSGVENVLICECIKLMLYPCMPRELTCSITLLLEVEKPMAYFSHGICPVGEEKVLLNVEDILTETVQHLFGAVWQQLLHH